ncbi:DUF4302 domain-containing protein [Chitinophaga qingshengii]|uniref:DUF4302 domain-containing protein n=1 Tax=Chitinophaga qingshengii TaxID=1569794 RepID=A0ABR7TY92_9BACT|nr:DUF4302 domain-containing protein [Chitinophaga qingshengii]MBC9934750.1 DUF4302 domain-containing protein [Chitinophaga qingshengii]
MKKFIIAGMVLCTLATACRKDNDGSVFGVRPEERMNATLTAYKKQLTGGTNGWKAYLFPDGGYGFGFYFKFGENNRVNMLGDLTPETGQDLAESSYRMGAQQRPSLVFDTYSYIHLLSDPDGRVFGGIFGRGYDSDFEFGYDSTRTDTIFLTGSANKSKMMLVRANAQEETAYAAGGLNTIQNAIYDYVFTHPIMYVTTPDGKKMQTAIVPDSRTFSLIYEEDGAAKTFSVPYAYTLNGIITKEPFKIGNKFYQEVFYDDAKQVLYLKDNGKNVELQPAPGPIFALHVLLGVAYNQLNVSDATQGAFSPNFLTMWKAAKTKMPTTAPNLQLNGVDVIFDPANQQMGLNFKVTQAPNQFTALFVYDYTKSKDGVFTFTMQDVKGDVATVILPAVKPILDKLGVGKYRVDYFSLPGNTQMGQIIGVDDPAFILGGTLR